MAKQQKSAFDQALGMFANAATGIGNAVGGAVQQYTQPVQQFVNKATQTLSNDVQGAENYFNPSVSGQNGFWSQNNPIAQGMANVQQAPGNILHAAEQVPANIGHYFDPTYQGNFVNGQNRGFWSDQNPVAQGMGFLENGTEWLAGHPFTFGDQASDTLHKNLDWMPYGIGNQAAFVAGLAPEVVQGLLNTPHDIAKAGVDIGTDLQDLPHMTWQKAIGDLAEAALPILTIATLGEGSALKEVGKEALEQSISRGTLEQLMGAIGKGALKGSGYGAGFGFLGGLEQGKDAKSVQDQLTGTIPSVLQGAEGGAILGGTLSGLSKAKGIRAEKIKVRNAEAAANALGEQPVNTASPLSPEEMTRGAYQPPAAIDENGMPVLSDEQLAMRQVPSAQMAPEGPQLTDQELAMNQLRQANPQIDYGTPTSDHLQNLMQTRDALQAKVDKMPTTTRAADTFTKIRDGLAEDLNKAQSTLKNYDLIKARYKESGAPMATKTEIRAHISDLKNSIKDANIKIKAEQDNLTSANVKNTDSLKVKVQDLNNQIAQEQQRLRVGSTLENSNVQPGEKVKFGPDEQTTTEKVKMNPEQTSAAEFQNAINGFANDADEFGTNRNFANKVEGRVAAGKTLGEKLKNYVAKNFTPEEQARVMMARDGSIDPTTLTPKEAGLLQQLTPYFDKAAEVRAERDPNFDPIKQQGYIPAYLEKDSKMPLPLKKALSKVSPENWEREIKAFDSPTGQTLVGTADSLGLKQVGSTFEDANGNQYQPRTAKLAEYQSIGLKPNLNLGEVLDRYTKSTIKFKEHADAINALKSGDYANQISSTPRQGWKTVNVKGLEGMYFEPKLAQAVESLGGVEDTRTPVGKAYDKAAAALRNTIFYNGLIHPMNMYFNAIVGAGKKGPLGILDLHKQIAGAAADVFTKNEGYVEGQRAGIGMGGFDKSGPGITEKVLGKITGDNRIATMLGHGVDTVNPLNLSRGMTAFADDTLRLALQRTFEDRGMSPTEAQTNVNHFLVDYGNTSAFEKGVVNRVLIFYPWLKGNLGIMGDAATHPIANAGSILTAAVMYGALQEAQSYIQQQTGNKDAKLRFPGVIGEVRNVAQAPGEIWNGGMAMKGQPGIPSVVASHVSPILRTAIQEGTNTAYLPDMFKANKSLIVKDNMTPEDATSARLKVAETNLLGPAAPINAITGDKKTLGEVAQNNLYGGLGLTTPHLQGFQAEPNQPNAKFLGLNVNDTNAKQGTGMEIVQNRAKLTQKFSQQDMNDLNSLSGKTWKEKSAIFQKNPKLWDVAAQTAKTDAKANGQGYDPIYKQNLQGAKEYFGYINQSGAAKNEYAYQHQNVIQIDRERDAYYSSPEYQKQAAAYAASQGKPFTPSVANPLFKFDNSQIADYHKWSSLTQGSPEKAQWAANHPWVKDASVGQEGYQLQLLQQDWNNRPQGQSEADFLKQHPYANFAGVDESGQIIPLREPAANPWLQLNKDQKQVVLLYTAERTTAGATDAKTKALIKANPWLPAYWAANSAYYANSNNGGDTTGLGFQFGSGNGSGGGSGYGGSKYGGSGYKSEGDYLNLYALQQAENNVTNPNLSSKINWTLGAPKSGASAASINSAIRVKNNDISAALKGGLPVPKLEVPKASRISLRSDVGSGGFNH